MSEIEYRRFLKSKGQKITKQRLLVFKVLEDNPERHMTAEEIYKKVSSEAPETGLATVYRTTQLLTELGVIDKVNFDDGFIRYELSLNHKKHRHHHLICRECEKVTSFEEDLLDTLEMEILKETGFQVTDHEVKLYGYCCECRNKKIT